MVQKGTLRNEWVDAYITDGSLSEVPEALVALVKEAAERRKDVKLTEKPASAKPLAQVIPLIQGEVE